MLQEFKTVDLDQYFWPIRKSRASIVIDVFRTGLNARPILMHLVILYTTVSGNWQVQSMF